MLVNYIGPTGELSPLTSYNFERSDWIQFNGFQQRVLGQCWCVRGRTYTAHERRYPARPTTYYRLMWEDGIEEFYSVWGDSMLICFDETDLAGLRNSVPHIVWTWMRLAIGEVGDAG
jgi:hypothetical protein